MLQVVGTSTAQLQPGPSANIVSHVRQQGKTFVKQNQSNPLINIHCILISMFASSIIPLTLDLDVTNNNLHKPAVTDYFLVTVYPSLSAGTVSGVCPVLV